MSRPIKETPVLSGREMDKFLETIYRNKDKRVPKEDYEKSLKLYNEVMKKANFRG